MGILHSQLLATVGIIILFSFFFHFFFVMGILHSIIYIKFTGVSVCLSEQFSGTDRTFVFHFFFF
jgi:hypothetical protein